MAVRSVEALQCGSAGEEKVLQNAFFRDGNGLRLDAFEIVLVMPQEFPAAILGLGRIVDDIHPFRQNAGAGAALELAGAKWSGSAGLRNGLTGELQIIAQQLPKQLRRGEAFKQ